ncbi:MAG: hypothetical protein AAF366_07995 [Pseudomonadota bacterium]
MAERYRSSDGTRETDAFVEDMPETPDHQGRSGGAVARDVGTQDALMRATTQGARGITRVTKRHNENNRDVNDDGGPKR